MKQETVWTDWNENPLAAAYEAARANGIDTKKLDAVLLKCSTWAQFDATYFLDDLLQEIAGATNIVVQYGADSQKYRAAVDPLLAGAL